MTTTAIIILYLLREVASWSEIGCYTDDGNRDLDLYKGSGYNQDRCAAACANYKYFALQYHGQCFCGNAYATSGQYRKVDINQCGSDRLGRGWRNMVYFNRYYQIGCFVDDGARDLDVYKGSGHNQAKCYSSCSAYKYFALQYHGQCFCGNAYSTSSRYRKVNTNECGADGLGRGWRNMVYGRRPGQNGCNKKPKCDVCQPLLNYRNAATVCRDRITKAKNNAQDVKDKIDVLHGFSKKAKSAQNSIATIDRFMRANSWIIGKIPKVGRLIIKVSNSLDKFGDVLKKIGDKEPALAKLKARLANGIKKLNSASQTVDKSRKIADQGRNALIIASDFAAACCSSIDLSARNNALTSAVVRTATNAMNTCATFNINVVLPSINPDFINVIGAIADVVEHVRKWIEDVKNAILRDADTFMCCEDFGRFLGDVAEVFGDLVGLVTCAESGAMGGILDESFNVLLKSLSPLFDGVNNQIKKYNRFTTEFEKRVSVKVLGFQTSVQSIQLKVLGCKVEMQNINPFSSIDISAGITMPKLSEINFAFGDGQFNVQRVFGNIVAECKDSANALVTMDRVECCDIAPKFPDGTTCGFSCSGCKNPATYWPAAVATKCGREPCWRGGSVCGMGTTCNSCCRGSQCPWYWFGVCKCK